MFFARLKENWLSLHVWFHLFPQNIFLGSWQKTKYLRRFDSFFCSRFLVGFWAGLVHICCTIFGAIALLSHSFARVAPIGWKVLRITEKCYRQLSISLCNEWRPRSIPLSIPGIYIYIYTHHQYTINIPFIYYSYTSSTAQGGGGSFRIGNSHRGLECFKIHRKLRGCESRMAERIHWLTVRWLDLCLLEWLQWLQWSPHPQLLDWVWCSAAVDAM